MIRYPGDEAEDSDGGMALVLPMDVEVHQIPAREIHVQNEHGTSITIVDADDGSVD